MIIGLSAMTAMHEYMKGMSFTKSVVATFVVRAATEAFAYMRLCMKQSKLKIKEA